MGEKGKKRAQIGKISASKGEQSELSDGLGKWKGPPFPLPRLPLGSLRSPIFFPPKPTFFFFFP